MRSLTAFVFAAVAVVGLVGCKEVKVENGEIPAQYLDSAAPYLGVYDGHFDGRPVRLEVSLDGNRPVLSFQDGRGSDLLHPTCDSRVGLLKTVTVSEKRGTYVLKRARFAFDPGACFSQIDGREVTLDFGYKKEKQIIDLSILQDTRWEQRCVMYPGDPARRIPPRYECHNEPVTIYMSGRFSR